MSAIDRVTLPCPDRLANGATARQLTPLLTLACGVIALNLAAAQPLVGMIAHALGLGLAAAGLVTTATLLGYGAGMVFLVPLTDLAENRRLVMRMLALDIVALFASAWAPNAVVYLAAAFAVGAATSSIQMLVPLVASLAPEAERGRVVGNVMSGVMIGILLSRPLATLIARAFGWRGVFIAFAVAIAAVALPLWRALPTLQPVHRLRYGTLVRSLWPLVRGERVLQRHALSATLAFGAFNVFWTIVALRLAQAPFGLGAKGIAAFAMAGVGGSVIAPIAGRLGDRGLTRPSNVAMHLLIVGALALAWSAGHQASFAGLALMVAASLLLDVGTVGDQTLGRRAINLVRPEARGRLNGLFTGTFFVGGAIASALASCAWAIGGWGLTCALGSVFGIGALVVSLSAYVREASG
ncbi:MFS transporter [Frateuria terrea]|uniref:Predicted arabinose efflux permease, MFS family n=1 Tax=Frateuria terrea TaxID=529704 RepID=A0A1H6Y562_9GAMM|nr:MFS transporter [Frateuria terrea]SEJ32270.1 Predicted arabinose efflux permease, MFS family [Frateuria terrea]SFP51591.1 Predicted arabinose efflux permease, MFS family [Frateuria terrea]